MCSLNEELNLLCFWCKTGNLYNISVVLKWRVVFFLDSLVPDAELKDNPGDTFFCIFNKFQVLSFLLKPDIVYSSLPLFKFIKTHK